MPDFAVTIVTYIDSDTPFQWGLELERVKIPMIIYTSPEYYDVLIKYNSSYVGVSVYFSKRFKDTLLEKLLLLEDSCETNPFNSTHIYWINSEYLQAHLSFEFIYSNLLERWLSYQENDFQIYYHHGHPYDMFFGGKVSVFSDLHSLSSHFVAQHFINKEAERTFKLNHSTPAIIEFDNGGINNYIASVADKPVLHVVGDSHSLFCFTPHKAIGVRNNVFVHTKDVSNYIVPFEYQFTHHLGSYTMHTFSKGNLIDEELLKRWSLKSQDFILFVFGEIDVRCHVWKQIHVHGRQLTEVVEALTENYINYILELSAKINIDAGIFGVTPPLEAENYSSEHKAIAGTIEERIQATLALNKCLEEKAGKAGIFYFDVYALYASERGDLVKEKSDTFCHISHYYKQPACDQFFSSLSKFFKKSDHRLVY